MISLRSGFNVSVLFDLDTVRVSGFTSLPGAGFPSVTRFSFAFAAGEGIPYIGLMSDAIQNNYLAFSALFIPFRCMPNPKKTTQIVCS